MNVRSAGYLLLFAAFCLSAAMVTLALVGCHTDPITGVSHLTDPAYANTTNIVRTVQAAASGTPSNPLTAILEAAGGLALAILTGWQAHAHRRISTLENGNAATKKDTKA